VEPGSVGLPSTTVLNIVSGKVDLRQNQTVAGLTGSGGFVTTDGTSTPTLGIDVANGAGPFTYGGVIGQPSETGYNNANVALEKRGPGTQILTGANNYTRGTSISGGSLLVNNATGSGTGSGAVNVMGGTLGGGNADGTAGFVAGPVTVNSGSLAPGSSTGILTLQNGLTFTGGAFDVEINGPVAGSLYDQLLVTGGNVALGSGVADLALSGAGAGLGEYYWIINNTGAGSTTGSFAGLAEGTLFEALSGTRFTIYYGANFATGQLAGGNDVLLLSAVPEPGSVVLLLVGLGVLAWWRRRKVAF